MVKSFKEYSDAALTTRIYPNVGNNYPYVLFGLIGETGELFEKFDILSDQELLIKEVGDVMWYLAGTYDEMKIDIAGAEKNINIKFSPNVKSGKQYLLNQIMVHNGKLFETVKKAIRDNNGVIDEARKEKIKNALDTLVAYVTEICHVYDVSVFEVMQANIDKLQGRKERGTLGGSGDVR